MSPRPLHPNTRDQLIDVAARLLDEMGPSTLSTRRLAAEAGMSTMAIYTYFGSMSALVREIVFAGFARLQDLFDLVESTDDPVADMALLGRVYRHNAATNPHVYTVMFGGASLGGFALTEEDRQHGRYVLTKVADCAYQCVAARRFRPEDAGLTAHQMWLGMHGTVTLELGGYLVSPYSADRCFEAQLISLMVGAGDDLDRAIKSVTVSADRFDAAFSGRSRA